MPRVRIDRVYGRRVGLVFGQQRCDASVAQVFCRSESRRTRNTEPGASRGKTDVWIGEAQPASHSHLHAFCAAAKTPDIRIDEIQIQNQVVLRQFLGLSRRTMGS